MCLYHIGTDLSIGKSDFLQNALKNGGENVLIIPYILERFSLDTKSETKL